MSGKINELIVHEIITDALNHYSQLKYNCDAYKLKSQKDQIEIRHLRSILFMLIKKYESYLE
jgi:hypothetical protein